jgi:hypothetical protein
MTKTLAEQAEILKDDAQRRMMREIDEWIAANTTTVTESRLPYVSERQRIHRASQDSWARGMKRNRTLGIACDDNGKALALASDGPTMLVTRDGTSTVVPITRKGSTRKNRAIRTVARDTRPEALKFNLAPIGDQNH